MKAGEHLRRARRRAGATGLALAVTLLAIALVLIGGFLADRGSPTDVRGSAAGERGAGAASVALPAASRARPCPGRTQRAIPAPTELAVFEGRQHKPDGLPVLNGAEGHSWVPARTLLADQVRRVGLGRFEAEVHLVPTLGVRTDGRCQPGSGPAGYEGEGVCLTVGVGEGIAVRCFTDETVRAGRAVALTGPRAADRPAGEVHGIVPDGVTSVGLAWKGGTLRVPVVGNAFEARLPGVQPGERLRLAYRGPAVAQSQAACRPSPALLDAVPALRGDPPVGAPPRQLAAVVDIAPRLSERWARVWGGGDGVSFWVVPQLRCGVAITNDRACMATVTEEDGIVAGAVCADAATIRRRGASDWNPVDDRPVLAGFAPAGATAARIALPDADDEVVPIRDGAFAAVLEPDVRMDHPDAYRLSFER